MTADDSLDEYSLITENGVQQCPYCGDEHYPPIDPIITEHGARYDDPLETSPGTAWYHPECWKEREAKIQAGDNRSLFEFE